MTTERVVIYPVCDYAPGDLAWAEILLKFNSILPENARVNIPVTAPSFNTIVTGFCLAQGLLAESYSNVRVIGFGNTAPRQDLKSARKRNEGEKVLRGVLRNKRELLVVNSGYSLSFLRDELAELYEVEDRQLNTQFRSRDQYPHDVNDIVAGDYSRMSRKLDPLKEIPEAPVGVVAYIDSFGNLKVTYRANDPELAKLKEGQEVRIRINGREHKEVFVSRGNFSVKHGQVAFGPGSSGFDRRFYEVFLRGGHAHEYFGLKDPDQDTAEQLAQGMKVEILT